MQRRNCVAQFIRCSTAMSSSPTVCALLLLIPDSLRVEAGPHEDRLLDRIFHGSSYFVTSLPVADDSETLQVDFGASVVQIVDLDMRNEVLRTSLWLHYSWHNYKLMWNVSDYGGLSMIVVPASSVWIPDILLYNSIDENMETKVSTNVLVKSTGMCQWYPPGIFSSPCAIDIAWFPFDVQTCHMKFGPWSYGSDQVNLSLLEFGFENYVLNGQWDVADAQAERHELFYQCCTDPFVDITFTLRLRRRSLYYMLYLILPTAMVACLTLLGFLLPPDSGEKIGLGITVFLSMTVFQLIIAEAVPQSSHAVPLMATFIGVIMLLCVLSLVMNVVVLNLHHRPPGTRELPRWVRVVFCECLGTLLCLKKTGGTFSLRPTLQRHRDSATDSNQHHHHHQQQQQQQQQPVLLLDDNKPSIRPTEDSVVVMMKGVESYCASILSEVRLLSSKVKDDVKDSAVTSDWQFVAMVVDRLCFIVFTVCFVVATLAVLIRPATAN